jgi:hypothetical protein
LHARRPRELDDQRRRHSLPWGRALRPLGPNAETDRANLPATKWGGTTRIIATEARWGHAYRLLHDNTLKPEDRVAGLLVLL